MARRIVESVARESAPAVTVSCGAANWKQEEQVSLDLLFVRADRALYQAKK
ncbi:diguanylate cyclase domain-containing protein [Alteribacillus sp. JSM 102045]|uniref:diguanylate cyclase domain-containing protein n=1 Tax=Alteribacillus sp. JSM 102045 TaxID=1562101 RepID=UPI0035BFE37D